MSRPQIALLVIFAVSALLTVATIGRPREPMSPLMAAFSLCVTAVLAWLVVAS